MSTDFGPFWSWNMMLILIRFRNSSRKGMQRIFISTWLLVGHTKSVGASCTSWRLQNQPANFVFSHAAERCSLQRFKTCLWELETSSIIVSISAPWWFETCFLFMSIWDDPIWQLSNWIDLPSTSWLYLWIIFQNSQPTGKDSKWTANKKVVGVGQNNFYRFPKHSILDNSTKSAVELNILKWTENLQERFKIDASKLELWKFRRTWIRQAVKDKIEVRSQKSFSRGHGKMLGDVETNCGLKNWTASIWKNYRIIMSSCLFLSLSKVFDILFCLVFFLHEKQHICKRQMDLWWNTHIPT